MRQKTGDITTGENIRNLRKRHGLSQSELAEALGVSLATVYRWESGRMQVRESHVRDMMDMWSVPRDSIVADANGAAGTGAHLNKDELWLMHLYRQCSTSDRALIVSTAERLAGEVPDASQVMAS